MTKLQTHRFSSPAKLNLFLHIVGRRVDGYHELETLFQFLDHSDTIDLKVTPSSEIKLTNPIQGVSTHDNLLYKAAKILQESQKISLGVEISINKILPMGGGLGGGSSNAATVLLALNTLWNTKLSTTQLANLGVQLGADVPIFIHGFSALARGIGEQLTQKSPPEVWYLVSKPDCSISTHAVFTGKDLPRNTPKLVNDDIELENTHNDCQTFVIKHYPKVANLLSWLLEYAPSRMTGTGACIFSRFDSKNEALLLQSKLPKGIESFVAKGVNQSPLFAEIQAIKELLKP